MQRSGLILMFLFVSLVGACAAPSEAPIGDYYVFVESYAVTNRSVSISGEFAWQRVRGVAMPMNHSFVVGENCNYESLLLFLERSEGAWLFVTKDHLSKNFGLYRFIGEGEAKFDLGGCFGMNPSAIYSRMILSQPQPLHSEVWQNIAAPPTTTHQLELQSFNLVSGDGIVILNGVAGGTEVSYVYSYAKFGFC